MAKADSWSRIYSALAVKGHQLGAARAKLEALPHHRRRDAEPRRDVLGAHAVLIVQLGERLVLIGGMHVGADGVLGEADLGPVMLGVENATDRLVRPDLLALHAQQLREAAALPGIDQIKAGRLAARPDLGLRDRVLQHAERRDAGGKGLDVRHGVRDLPHVLGRLFQLAERHKHDLLGLGGDFRSVTHGLSPLVWGSAQIPRMNPCPSARPGEGEQEENRTGSLSARSGSEAKIGGDRFCSCWGCQGRAFAPLIKQTKCRAAAPYTRQRSSPARAETPTRRLRPLCGQSATEQSEGPPKCGTNFKKDNVRWRG